MALIALHDVESPWFLQAANDIRLIFPGVTFRTGHGPGGLYLYPVAADRDSSRKLSIMTRRTQQNGGRQPCTTPHKRISRDVRVKLERLDVENNIKRLQDRQSENSCSKGALLLGVLGQQPTTYSSSLASNLNQSGPMINRSAVASLLCGDWFLGIHAGSFFAKSLLPKSHNHQQDAASLVIDPSRVCLMCWHCRRQLSLEDEGRSCFDCPQYDKFRAILLGDLSSATVAETSRAGSGNEKLLVILNSALQQDCEAFGKFAGRIRQARRGMRWAFEARQAILTQTGFDSRRLQWRQRGLAACRHGVFFARAQVDKCPCMDRDHPEGAWSDARHMASIDHDLRAIVVRPFLLAERLNYV